jgi:hypothetical protein
MARARRGGQLNNIRKGSVMASQDNAGGGIVAARVIIFVGYWLLGKFTDWSGGTKGLVVTIVGGFILFAIGAEGKKT